MWALACVVVASAIVFVILGVVKRVIFLRQSWDFRCQQESPSIYTSFESLKGVDVTDIQILSRPSAWPRTRFGIVVPERESWYCHASKPGYFSVTAEYRYRWWGWRAQWRVQMMDEDAMRDALKSDAQAYRRAFGHQVENRLYA